MKFTKYDELFEENIILRGNDYYNKHKLKKYEYDDKENICNGEVEGTKLYKCNISFYGDKEFLDATCDCNYYVNNNKYCKHIYCLLLKYCEKNNLFINNNINKEDDIKKENNGFLNSLFKKSVIFNDNDYDDDYIDDEEDDEDMEEDLEEVERQEKRKKYKDIFGLFDNEIDEIEEHGYEPSDFEEEEMDDGDYYCDDVGYDDEDDE